VFPVVFRTGGIWRQGCGNNFAYVNHYQHYDFFAFPLEMFLKANISNSKFINRDPL
jgi:hypothetical protein